MRPSECRKPVVLHHWLPLSKKRYGSLLEGRGLSCVAEDLLGRGFMRAEVNTLLAEGRAMQLRYAVDGRAWCIRMLVWLHLPSPRQDPYDTP
jgi:hypothetical protein